jgi:hypothetical protein
MWCWQKGSATSVRGYVRLAIRPNGFTARDGMRLEMNKPLV